VDNCLHAFERLVERARLCDVFHDDDLDLIPELRELVLDPFALGGRADGASDGIALL